jgi:hypothetical protein
MGLFAKKVDFTDRSAFAGALIELISVEGVNRRFVRNGDLVIDSIDFVSFRINGKSFDDQYSGL